MKNCLHIKNNTRHRCKCIMVDVKTMVHFKNMYMFEWDSTFTSLHDTD